MRTSEIVGILKDHDVPQSRDHSYKRYSAYNIRYLKNVGLLDCYYDYGSNQDMIFTTGFGKRYIELHDGNADLDELRDIVGRVTVETTDAEGRTVRRHFADRGSARKFADSLGDRYYSMRRTTLEDVYLSITGGNLA